MALAATQGDGVSGDARWADDVTRLLLAESADDEGNARCAHALFGGEFVYTGALGWLRWTGTHWQRDAEEAEVDQAVLAALKRRRLTAVEHEREAVVKCTAGSALRLRAAKSIFRALATRDLESFDAHPDELNVANGVLDLRTRTLTPHRPEQRFTYCLATPYDPAADARPWTDFLAQTVEGGAEVLAYLQAAVGYTLTGHTSEECLWYVHGPLRSGKGAFTETLLALLGAPLGVEADFATFTARREGDTQNFDLAPLKAARLVVTSESNSHETLNPGKIKQLTGGNFVRCAYKHRDHFSYRPQFKAWLVSNHPASADVDDDALWQRVKVLLFPHSRAGREDKTLKARLRSPDALRGVLRWAVEGAAAWYAAEGGLAHPRAVDANTQAQRAEQDMVRLWLLECCTVEADAWTPHADLYGSYAGWCARNGVQAKSAKGFTQALRVKGFATEVRWLEGRTVRVIGGVRL